MFRGSMLLLCALGCSRGAPVAPAREPTIQSGVYKLIVASTHEISCSLSFERHDDDAMYELTIAADNSATLVVTLRTSKAFGPSSSKFTNGPANRTHQLRKLRYVGRANQGATFEGTEEHSGASARLRCKPASVVLTDAAKSQLAVISCSGLPSLPEGSAKYFSGPAPLATGTGVMLAIDDHGHGSPMITLRRGF